MTAPTRPRGFDSFHHPGFPNTQWSLVLAARDGSGAAFSALYELYWYPLYVFARRSGSTTEQAQDLLQGFFLRSLEKLDIAPREVGDGHFRSWLLASFKHFTANQWNAARAQKRGGDQEVISIDARDAEGRYLCEPADGSTPEQLYDRCWALTLLSRVMTALQAEYARSGKESQFEALKELLTVKKGSTPYALLATQLGMTEGAVKVAVFRLRDRYKKLLREEIGRTLESPAEIEAELHHLLEALR